MDFLGEMRVNKSLIIFEKAFVYRFGQTPTEWIMAKVKNGSELPAIEYLYDITAAALSQKYSCRASDFDYYYKNEEESAQPSKQEESKTHWQEKLKSPFSVSQKYTVRDQLPPDVIRRDLTPDYGSSFAQGDPNTFVVFGD